MPCEACRHIDANALNAELRTGNRSLAAVANFYQLDEQTLRIHKREHMQAVALKVQYDPVTLIQDLVNLKSELQARLGIGLSTGEHQNGKVNLENDEFAILAKEYRQTLAEIAKITGAKIKPDWKDQIPTWNKIEKTLMKWAQNQEPKLRDELYLMLEEVDKIGGSG